MNVLAVIPTYLSQPQDLEVLLDCLTSLRQTAPDCEVLVVDDFSPAPELVEEIQAASPRLKLEVHRKEENTGFAKTVNVGLRHALAEGKDAVLVNADVEFPQAGWLDRMLAQENEAGDGPAAVVGARLLYPSGLIQHAGIFFSFLHRTFGHRFQYAPGDLPDAQFAKVVPVTGALQLIRHDALSSIGIYDENFQMGFEDVDYCIRVFDAGGECVYQPRVVAYHYESLFRSRPSPKLQDWQARSWLYFMRKYRSTSFSRWMNDIA